MSEPRTTRRKTPVQLSAQIGRIYDASRDALSRATTEEERRRIIARYNRAGDAFTRYNSNMYDSSRMRRAVRGYYERTGTLTGPGLGEAMGNIAFPRREYMRRNRR